jgi:radical SAM protein with 4Fe4S-binding SPASM domain
MAVRRFQLNQPLPLGQIVERSVEDQCLFIDPQLPAWIALPPPEAQRFRRLARGEPIQALVLAEPDLARSELSRFLARVIAAGFLGDRVNMPETGVGKRIQVHLTNRCNLRCIHCYMDSGIRAMAEAEAERWCDLITVLSQRYGKLFLSVSGGEPLMSDALFPLLERARKLGCATGIITNGLLLKGSVLERLNLLVDVCSISLDGLSPETHDYIRGNGAFLRTYTNLLGLADTSFRKVLNITAFKTNRDELADGLKPFVEQLPFKVDIDLATLTLEGRGVDHAALALSASEFRELLLGIAQQFVHAEFEETRPRAQLVDEDGAAWKPIPVRRKVSCGYGDTLAIYSNGDVSPCLTPRFIQGNIFRERDRVLELIDRGRAAARVDRLEECRTCFLRHICGGRCHLAQLRVGSLPSQVTCPDSYKQSMMRNLVAWGSSG